MQWNIDQVRLFLSVVGQHSFSAVARDLPRAQSAVSSAVARVSRRHLESFARHLQTIG